MQERLYWLGFSAFPGIGPVRFKLLRDYFGSAKGAWTTSVSDLRQVGLSEKLSSQFDVFRRRFSFDEYVRVLKSKQIEFLTQEDSDYPSLLRQISDPPIVLYIRGNKTAISSNTPHIAVVGTRKISEYGIDVTQKLSRELTKAGFIVTSGMAYGVDTHAHSSAIEAGGNTVAVLGCGVDIIHPTSNTTLYWTIVKRAGCVISEYPPGSYATKGLFPARNRIVSGLSLGVVVIEGTLTSGSLITARFAGEQGREVFAVPGPISSVLSQGPLKLLKDGATICTDIEDIQNIFHGKNTNVNDTQNSQRWMELPSDQKRVVELLAREHLHFDQLVIKSNMGVIELSAVLSQLELSGIIKNNAGIYRLK